MVRERPSGADRAGNREGGGGAMDEKRAEEIIGRIGSQDYN